MKSFLLCCSHLAAQLESAVKQEHNICILLNCHVYSFKTSLWCPVSNISYIFNAWCMNRAKSNRATQERDHVINWTSKQGSLKETRICQEKSRRILTWDNVYERFSSIPVRLTYDRVLGVIRLTTWSMCYVLNQCTKCLHE